MFPEFRFRTEQILNSYNKVSDIASEHTCDILLVPRHNSFSNPKKDWKATKKMLSDSDIIIEDTNINDDFISEAMGFWFDRKGPVYCFPKVRKHHPVHKIPERDIGVTIYAEMYHIKPEDLESIKILYNPSAEDNDIYLRGRNMRYSGMDDSKIIEQYSCVYQDPVGNWDEIERCLLEGKKLRLKVNDEEKKKVIIELKKDSSYLTVNKSVSEALKHRNIPIIRCDTRNCSGLLYKPKNSQVDLEYNDTYCMLRLDT
ncbi:MAG: hypothetical protein DRN71_02755 [Candidatus Nanohalarchaeota archaeon]|nr:MAG: hypothetical protein DRN71_02755 [Candidatus Nanohaloarchaeota archaeon]